MPRDGAQHLYDALDQRVAIFGGSHAGETIYFAGVPIALHNPTSGAYTDLIYASGQMIAEVAGTQTATPTYRLPDHLGSLVAQTDNSGNVTGTNVFLPFGQLLSSTTRDQFQFTDLPQDTENSSYHAGFRNLSTQQSRWLSPDPYNGNYDITNPQSFNRYVYAMNNPLNATDPTGLDSDENGDDGLADVNLTIFTSFGTVTVDGTTINILMPEGTLNNFLGGNDGSSAPSLYNKMQWSTVTDASLGYLQLSDPNTVFLLSEGGYLSSGVGNSSGGGLNCSAKCVQIFHNADVTVHGLAIATAAVAAVPFFAPAVASAVPVAASAAQSVAVAARSLVLNPSTWTNVGGFVSGLTPASLPPPTYSGAAGVGSSWLWDHRHR